MERTHGDLLRQTFQRERGILLQKATGVLHFRQLLLLRIAFVRHAALARAKSGLNGMLDIRIKADIFTQGMTGTAGRATHDPRRLHGKDKPVVSARIAGQHGLPAILIGHEGWIFHHQLLLQAYL